MNTMIRECPDGASGHLHADDVPTLVAIPTAPVTSVAAGGGGEGECSRPGCGRKIARAVPTNTRASTHVEQNNRA